MRNWKPGQIFAALLCMLTLLPATAMADLQRNGVVIFADTPKVTRWAAVHVTPDETVGDHFYHVEVFEHPKGAKPWVFKRLSQHMVITGEALEKSRITSRARTYAYKDVEFRIVYKHWLANKQEQAQTPVCKTTIEECLKVAVAD
ncbi:DUF5086 family protein [Ochrobactrum sp. RH2CCR150]|uniref:DUF5086 family protein n=1 Tax=Ochrobactrum sp. RH2CCR150 TaxID=2587044 RepID=UPI00180533ED|nr:hypothetical protein [Ochrobactrum sp. RH2CCR150]